MSPEKSIMSRQYQNQHTILTFDSFSSVVSGRNDSHLVIKRSSPLRIHCNVHTLCHQRFCNKQEDSFSDGYAEKYQMLKDFPASVYCKKIHPHKTELRPREFPCF